MNQEFNELCVKCPKLKSHPRCQGITNRNETYSDREAKNVYAGDKAAEIDAA
jgi:hypothetical protein